MSFASVRAASRLVDLYSAVLRAAAFSAVLLAAASLLLPPALAAQDGNAPVILDHADSLVGLEIGGDEFIVLAPGSAGSTVAQILFVAFLIVAGERIRAAVKSDPVVDVKFVRAAAPKPRRFFSSTSFIPSSAQEQRAAAPWTQGQSIHLLQLQLAGGRLQRQRRLQLQQRPQPAQTASLRIPAIAVWCARIPPST